MIRLYVSDDIAALLNRLVDEEATRIRNSDDRIQSDDRKTWPESLKKLDRAKVAIKEARTWARNRVKG